MHTFGLANLQDDERDTARKRPQPCAFDLCRRSFIPTEANQRFHDPICARRADNRRKSAARRAQKAARQ